MSQKVEKQSNFIDQLCRYYMEFLKGGFKSTRFPKRYIRLVNEKGFKIGVDLSKYEKFNSHIYNNYYISSWGYGQPYSLH